MDKDDKTLSPDNPVVRIGWEEFLGYGLLRFVNSFLHIFGLVIICEMDGGKVTSVYPARTIWRGFPVEKMSESYRKVAELMDRDHAEILKFAKEE